MTTDNENLRPVLNASTSPTMQRLEARRKQAHLLLDRIREEIESRRIYQDARYLVDAESIGHSLEQLLTRVREEGEPEDCLAPDETLPPLPRRRR